LVLPDVSWRQVYEVLYSLRKARGEGDFGVGGGQKLSNQIAVIAPADVPAAKPFQPVQVKPLALSKEKAVSAVKDDLEGEETGGASSQLLELFGELPKPGTSLAEFLSSEQCAKLRSGAFWREVAEAAGATFIGELEFAGLRLEVKELGPDSDDEHLARWCADFATKLTKSSGLARSELFGQMRSRDGHYWNRGFSPYLLVVGHLLGTFLDSPRRDEPNEYFERSRIALMDPHGAVKAADLCSVEEGYYQYLLSEKGGVLDNASARTVITSMGITWKDVSRIYISDKDSTPWRNHNNPALMLLQFADVWFRRDEILAAGLDFEEEIKKAMFRPEFRD
jgi:hypothetical protein